MYMSRELSEPMTTRKRRYLGCLGVIAALAMLLVAINFALSLYYKHQSALIALEMAKRGYPATFDEMIAKQNAIPADEHNGAIDMLEAFTRFNDEGVDYALLPAMGNYELPSSGTPISSEAMATMKRMLDQNAAMMELASRGLDSQKFLFPIDYHDDFSLFPIEWGKHIRTTARIMRLRAIYAGESGNSDMVIESVREILAFGDRFARQPSIDAAIHNYTLLTLGYVAATESAEHGYVSSVEGLTRLEAAIQSATISDITYALWTNRLTDERAWDRIPGLAELFDAYRDEPAPLVDLAEAGFEYLRLMSFLYDRDNYLACRIVADPKNPVNSRRLTDSMRTDPVEAFQVITTSMLITDQLMHARQCTALMVIRTMRFRIENSRLPNASEFDALAKDCSDIDGHRIRYKPAESGFVIYSVGLNHQDDNGLTRAELKGADDEVIEIRLPR